MNIKDIMFLNKIFGRNIIHVESPHIFRDKLTFFLEKYDSKCYCITPTNYLFVKANYGINYSEKEFREFLKEYYLELKEKGINLQLHVHLSINPKLLPYQEKKNKIEEAYLFFRNELDITPTEIVFGWWAYDEEAEEVTKRLDLKIIKKHLHIYDSWIK